jgi:hypothetical protein
MLANYYLASTNFDTFIEKSFPSWRYSRYADDITLSTNLNIKREDIIKVRDSIYKELYKRRLKPNLRKTKIQIKDQRQDIEVTGIKVAGSKLLISKEYLNKTLSKGVNDNKSFGSFSKQTMGCLNYIKSVNKEQYNQLIKKIKEEQCK